MNLPLYRRPLTIALLSLFILIAIFNIFLQIHPVKTTQWNYLYNVGYALIYLMGACVSFASVKQVTVKSSTGKAFLFLGLGLLSYGAGLLMWAYYNLILLIEIPYPSMAEILFIPCFISFIAIGCLQLLSLFSTLVTKRHIAEAIGIFAASCLFILGVSKPDISNDLPVLTAIANIAYPLGDTILLTLAFLTLRVAGGKMQQGVLFLVLGLLVQVIADFIFTFRTTQETYWNGDISDVFFTLSGTLLTLGIIALYYNFINNDEAPKRYI